MTIPNSAADYKPEDIKDEIPDINSEFINNPHYGKKVLTRFEALDIINQLSMILIVDERNRSGK